MENQIEKKSVLIPWSEDEDINAQNMQAAIDGGATELVGEPGKIYRLKLTAKGPAPDGCIGKCILQKAI